MVLDRASNMQSALCLKVCGMGLLWRFESPGIDSLSGRFNFGTPFFGFFIPADTKKSTLVVGLCFPAVLLVYAIRHVSQVAKSVVGAVAVDVVDLTSRPFAGYIKPSEPMGVEMMPHSADHYITEDDVFAPKQPALRALRERGLAAWDAPKNPGIFVVSVARAKRVNANVWVCHGR